jgi:RNA polymerase sigma factor (sigma-70 family)
LSNAVKKSPSMAAMRPKEVNAPPVGETIEELFAALESPLLGYAQRLLGDLNVAEDIIQDAFMKLHAQFDEVREPRKWLYRTVHNRSLNQRRQSRKIVALHPVGGNENAAGEREGIDPQLLPDEEISRWEGIDLVRLSLATLDERSRELIRLKFHEDLSYKEISARTGLTAGHVGYLLHHALKRIADELAKNGVVP